eukprot:GFYU01041289.1.p1 GENE.GFYU01041289.1~~GFYU01041289.1.p1  ORF type:complete len:177 (-),score=35.20 GFYU01041289.1:172-636(-)
MHLLAMLFEARGDSEEAKVWYTDCLAARRESLGDIHTDTLCSMSSLGSLWFALGEHDLAERLYTECLTLRRTVAINDPDTLRSMYDLASLYIAQGKLVQAEDLLEELVPLANEMLGRTHAHTVEYAKKLTQLYRATDRPEEAKRVASDYGGHLW